MSGLWRLLLGANQLTLMSGSLSGSSSLAIHSGAILVTLTGKGGDGYVDPGQPFIADNRTYSWNSGTSAGTANLPDSGYTLYPHTKPAASGTPTSEGQVQSVYWSTGSPGAYILNYWDYTAYQTGGNEGQAYIAPYNVTGASTTATLNGVTRTWAGGNGGPATASVQTLASTGAGQSMSYVVPGTGSISYSYTY